MRGFCDSSEKVKQVEIQPKDLTEERLEEIKKRLGYACEPFGMNPANAVGYYRQDITDLLNYIKNGLSGIIK